MPEAKTISLSRRQLLRSAAGLAAGSALSWASPNEDKSLPDRSLGLMDEVERRACRYFIERADPATGLVLDRSGADGETPNTTISSIAATGFGLSALCIASRRGFTSRETARAAAERALEFFAHRATHERGFFYHFIDASTGRRAFNCELSSVDTAWLLCGIIHARQHFDTPALHRLADEILKRVDWKWMMADGATLSHGWTPEQGFLPYRWDSYCELLAMYLLAIGSDDSPIPSSSWATWVRPRALEAGSPFIDSRAPLFVHQYSHAWFDFRRRHDAFADYFQNSRLATLRHRKFCLKLRGRFPWIDENMWGITASESAYGYIDWGGPQTVSNAKIDGTLVPCAAGGSLVFLPEDCVNVLETMIARYGKQVWKRYGFVDAFNPERKWWCPEVLGIDLGIMLLMAENLRGGSVWADMAEAPEVKRGFDRAGFWPSSPADLLA